MSLSRIFSPTPARNRGRSGRAAAPAALAAAIFLSAPVHAQSVTVTVTDLHPAGYTDSLANGVSGDTQVGSDGHAVLWHGTADSIVDLDPTQTVGGTTVSVFDETYATGVSGNTQVGYGFNYTRPDGQNGTHALLWHGTADSAIDLTPPGRSASALAVSGDTQVGSDGHAVLWHGTADSIVDLNPKGFDSSQANAVSGDMQVGTAIKNKNIVTHAFLWHGTAASAVDLNPANYNGLFDGTYGLGVSDNTQVGYGDLTNANGTGTTRHALLWHGTAASVIDLSPPGMNSAAALGCAGDVQVGAGRRDNFSPTRALLWAGTAASVVDLSAFLPAQYASYSSALAVTGGNGVYDVVGVAFLSTGGEHAIVWHVVFAPPAKPVIQHLYPASRTEGREAFALTVSGSGFTTTSVVQWNGAAQPTTYLSPTQVVASIPASLIASPKTVKITVKTPGVGTSNSRVETVMPRPTLSSLSPASKAAGAGAFTLTVTGTGFRPASFYAPSVVKWNGEELATAFVSDTKLTAQVPASLAAHAGTAQVTVTTPQVATSAALSFTITP